MPGKYVSLLEFFLDKRNDTKGGVEGFETSFSFSFDELDEETGITSDELQEMLRVLCEDQIMTEDGKEPIVGNAIIQENTVTIKNCTIEKITKYIEKIKRKLGPDLLKVNTKERRVSYLNHEYQFSRANRWRAFLCIYNERFNPVDYSKIFLRFYNGTKKNTVYEEVNAEGEKDYSNRKEVQNTILGILRDMRRDGFPDLIENIPEKGYGLKSSFY